MTDCYPFRAPTNNTPIAPNNNAAPTKLRSFRRSPNSRIASTVEVSGSI